MPNLITEDVRSPLEFAKADNLFSKIKIFGAVWDHDVFVKLAKIFDPKAIAWLLILFSTREHLLHALYRLGHCIENRKGLDYFRQPLDKRMYEASLVGHLAPSMNSVINTFVILYALDVGLVLYNGLGLKHSTDVPKLMYMCLSRYSLGLLLTRFKDWLLLRRRIYAEQANTSEAGDINVSMHDPTTRAAVVDELTSVVIWIAIGIALVENIAKDLAISVSSVFAFGGIGSATLVLALRSVFENVIGGVMLKLQDKFRVGERIATTAGDEHTGFVVDIGAFATTIRRVDNSNVAIPNSLFMHERIINWSRTPYRLFKTKVCIGMAKIDALECILDKIRERLEHVEGIVSRDERPLVVLASGFDSSANAQMCDDDYINIEVSAHLHKADIMTLSRVKSNIVNQIGLGMKDGLSTLSSAPTLTI